MRAFVLLVVVVGVASAAFGGGYVGGYMAPIKPGIVGYGYAGGYVGYGGLGYGGQPDLAASYAFNRNIAPLAFGTYQNNYAAPTIINPRLRTGAEYQASYHSGGPFTFGGPRYTSGYVNPWRGVHW